jgi:antitoxin VapB
VSERAKLFMSGGSQAVRLPKAYRFENQKEVLISRKGQQVILEPKRRRWSPAFIELAGTTPDFPYPDEPPPSDRGPDFE